MKLMQDVESLHIGTVEESSGMGQPTKLLRKRKLEELNEDALVKKKKNEGG